MKVGGTLRSHISSGMRAGLSRPVFRNDRDNVIDRVSRSGDKVTAGGRVRNWEGACFYCTKNIRKTLATGKHGWNDYCTLQILDTETNGTDTKYNSRTRGKRDQKRTRTEREARKSSHVEYKTGRRAQEGVWRFKGHRNGTPKHLNRNRGRSRHRRSTEYQSARRD